jgi:tol-pal system protein YbgF
MSLRSTAAAIASSLFIVIAVPAASQAQTPADLALRIDRLEAQLRELTGLIQQLTFRVEDLEQLVEVLRADNEALYQLLAEAGIDPTQLPAEAPAAVAAAPANAPGFVTPPANAAQGNTPVTQVPGAPLDLTQVIRPDGNLNLNGAPAAVPAAEPAPAAPAAAAAVTPAPAAAPAPANAGPVPPVAIAATGDAQADYNRAYQLFLNGDYSLAEEAFAAFVNSYPAHELAVDAKYWMAESLYARGEYSQAANQFYAVFVANQTHPKAPDMLLKLGLSFVQLGQRQSACDTFGLIPVRFPNASNALLDRVAAEQTNAGC